MPNINLKARVQRLSRYHTPLWSFNMWSRRHTAHLTAAPLAQGLDRVLIFTAVEGKILLRQCSVKYKKSGTDVRAPAAFDAPGRMTSACRGC